MNQKKGILRIDSLSKYIDFQSAHAESFGEQVLDIQKLLAIEQMFYIITTSLH